MAVATTFRKRLASMKKTWGEATKRKGGFSRVADGRYIAKLAKAYLHESEKEELFVVLSWVIDDGESKGESVNDYNRIENEDGMFYTMNKLRNLGVDPPDDPTELEAILKELTKEHPLARIRLKTKGEFQNTYIDRKVEEGEGEEDAGEEPEEEEESEEESESDEGDEDGEDGDEDGESEDSEDSDDGDEDSDEDGGEDAEEDSDAEDDEDSGEEIKVGQAVEVDGKGEGTIKKVDEENSLVHVVLVKTGKKVVVAPEVITIIPELTAGKSEKKDKPSKSSKSSKKGKKGK